MLSPQSQVSSSVVKLEVYTPPASKLDHRSHQLNWLESLFHPPREDLRVGGKIKYHLKNWLHLTHDPYILDLVKGFKNSLTKAVHPSQNSFPPPKSREALEVLDKEVASMLEKKAIRVISSGRNDRVFSRVGFKKGSVSRQSRPLLKAQRHDSCPWTSRDTTQGHDRVPYRVPYRVP